MSDNSLCQIKRALVSVSDKTGLVPLAQALAARGVEIISTGGTARALAEAGIAVLEVADVTRFPEILDGRVKTLHPALHGGILGRRDHASHREALAAHGIGWIDLVIVNLYPFAATVARGASWMECIENIDIGGPSLLRGAAKNHDFVTVLSDPADYDGFLAEFAAHDGATSIELRRRLAGAVYARTGAYDAAIAEWMAAQRGDTFPETLALGARRKQLLRYGENPHQSAALYVGDAPRRGVATAEQVQGKELSYNNLNDTDAAYELVAELGGVGPAVAIIKHANPCGAATARSLKEAYIKALSCDPVSAYGGVVALSGPIDAAAAEEITKIFTEVVIAPDATPEAKAIFAAKKNLRLLTAGGPPDPRAPGVMVRSLAGGLLVQSRDNGTVGAADLRVVTKRAPTKLELADLLFAFKVAKHVKSNAIVYAKNGATVGIGAGQMSRVDSARIAALKAADAAGEMGTQEPLTRGSVVASDAFFPFPDGLLAAAEAGATAVIQPGGSMRDADVIAAADEKGLAMVFTGMRHFRH
jgi:phosphoribosylaminoimidazolecarboxamide formyltransferase / IMP cyclohydrolase